MTQRTVGLRSYTVEDAAFGYWLQPWDVRHINHTRFRCRFPSAPLCLPLAPTNLLCALACCRPCS